MLLHMLLLLTLLLVVRAVPRIDTIYCGHIVTLCPRSRLAALLGDVDRVRRLLGELVHGDRMCHLLIIETISKVVSRGLINIGRIHFFLSHKNTVVMMMMCLPFKIIFLKQPIYIKH